MEKLLKEYGKIQEEYEVIGGYKIEEKMSKVCKGLNFGTEMLNKDYSVLSGGEKTRIELGKLLLEEPEILLLDEPTNHLDIETTEWLENYLKGYKGSVLIISHDRYFLDKVIDRIYEIKAGITEIFLGNYSYYLEEREVRYNNQLKHFGVQQNEIKNMEAAIKRFRQWGAQADNEAMFAKAKAIEKKLVKMDKIDRPLKDSKEVKIDLQSQGRSGKEVVTITNYNLLVTGKILIEHMNFNIRYKERVALIGANGTGKTTLIQNVLKSIESEDDRIKVGPSVKIGYLEQDVKFSDEEKSIIETVQFDLCMSPGEARNYLAKFKFYRDDVFKKVKNLSGGEKIRLILSLIIKQDITFLILDEPTNHIDIKTKEVLEKTLNAFKGTILFISHDRYFLNKLATRIYEIENSQLHEYLGNYEFYKLEKEKRTINNTVVIAKSNEKPTKKFERVRTIRKTNSCKLATLENDIEKIETNIAGIKKRIEDNFSDHELISKLLQEIKVSETILEEKMSDWIEFSTYV